MQTNRVITWDNNCVKKKQLCQKILLLSLFFLFNTYLIAQDSQKRLKIILRIDDYGVDNSKFYTKLIPLIKRTNTKITLGVVPFKKRNGEYYPISDTLLDSLKYYINFYKGVEIALHGYAHENLLEKDFASEFYKQPFAAQRLKITKGKELLERKLAISVKVFIPPFNSFDNRTTDILVSTGFKCLSPASYGKYITTNKLNHNLKYLPYNTLVKKLLKSNALNSVNCESGISVILMHTTDFVEGQTNTFQMNKAYIDTNNKITLIDLETVVNLLKKNPNIEFSTFSELCENNETDLTVERYKNSFIHMIIPAFWPGIPKESFLYLEKDEFNIKNMLYIIYPFTFYLFFIILGYALSAFVLNKFQIEAKFFLLLSVFIVLISLVDIIFFKIRLNRLIINSIWIGFV